LIDYPLVVGMAGKLTIGIDIGTTNVKASVLDTESAKIVAFGSQQHPLFHPQPGWAEQEASNYWAAVVQAIRQCLSQGPFADDLAAIGLSGLVGVALPVSADGNALRPAMIWMDARAEKECQEIRDRVGEETINHINGNRIAPWFVEPKALWIKKHEPHIFDNTYSFVSPSGYCTFRLCQKFTINTGDAGLYYPYDYKREQWNGEVAEAIGIPLDKYADIHRSYEVVGEVTAKAAEETGLRKGTKVVAGGTDISSAALGVGVTKAGQAHYSMGTGSNLGIMIPIEQRVNEYRILRWPHVLPHLIMFDAPMAFTGASLKWFKDKFADAEILMAERTGQNVFDLLTAQAAQVPPGCQGLLFLPYLGNTLSPNWNSKAKGVFFGLQPLMTRPHFIRALMEGVAFDLYANVKIAIEAGAEIDELFLNGGPTKSRVWNQITANVINRTLLLPDIEEAAPLGDAILAAIGVGLYQNFTEPIYDLVKLKAIFEPDPTVHEMYEEFFTVWQNIYLHLMEDMEKHQGLTERYFSA